MHNGHLNILSHFLFYKSHNGRYLGLILFLHNFIYFFLLIYFGLQLTNFNFINLIFILKLFLYMLSL